MSQPTKQGLSRAWQIHDLVAPIVTATYGDNGYSRAMIAALSERLADGDWDKASRGREHEIMLYCWNWYSGGGTAESVARRIEAALVGQSES